MTFSTERTPAAWWDRLVALSQRWYITLIVCVTGLVAVLRLVPSGFPTHHSRCAVPGWLDWRRSRPDRPSSTADKQRVAILARYRVGQMAQARHSDHISGNDASAHTWNPVRPLCADLSNTSKHAVHYRCGGTGLDRCGSLAVGWLAICSGGARCSHHRTAYRFHPYPSACPAQATL